MGLVGLLGGAILAVYGIPDALDPGTFSSTGATAVLYGQILVIPLIFLLVGVIGLHWFHEDTYGRLGRWSFYAVALGLVLMVSMAFYVYVITRGRFDLFGIEDGAFMVFILSYFVLVLLGSIPLGVACYRAGVLPTIGPLLLTLAGPVGFGIFVVLAAVLNWGGPFIGVTTPYGIAWVVIGYQLWTRTELAAGISGHDWLST